MLTRLYRLLKEAAHAVRFLKLRTFFCVLSVAIGIASITIIVASVEGAYAKVIQLVSRFGHDAVIVFGGDEQAHAVGARVKTLTLDDVNALRENLATAYLVVPTTSERGITVSYKDKKTQTQVVGSTNQYSTAWSWPVVEGSDISEEDVKGLRNVAMLGIYVVRQLFVNEDPVGKFILVKGIPTKVIAVLEERGTTAMGDTIDDRIIMPVTTVMRKLQNESKLVSGIRTRFVDAENISMHIKEIKDLLRRRHKLNEHEPDDFRVIASSEIVKFLMAMTGSLVLFLGVVGLISLAVAGFVLANLFLLSIKERTTEIGVRRALGAKKQDIMFQFLLEAVTITSIGGVAGFLLGVGSSKLLMYVSEFPLKFSWIAFAVGMVLSWAVGIGFGLQPAISASNLNPIEAIKE